MQRCPSMIMATTGPDIMKETRGSKNGLPLGFLALVLLDQLARRS